MKLRLGGSVGGWAGWLFADLFLVLFVVALTSIPPPVVADPGPEPAPPTGSPSPSPSPRPSPSPTGSPDHGPVVERKKRIEIVLKVPFDRLGTPAGQKTVLRQVNCALLQIGYQRRRAGMVLAFGGGPNTNSGISAARVAARKANQIVRTGRPRFDDVVSRSFWGGGSSGTLQLDIYFFEPEESYPVSKARAKSANCPGGKVVTASGDD